MAILYNLVLYTCLLRTSYILSEIWHVTNNCGRHLKFKMAAIYHVNSDGSRLHINLYINKTTSVPMLVLLSQYAQSYPLAAGL